jgi:hypothetical protein
VVVVEEEMIVEVVEEVLEDFAPISQRYHHHLKHQNLQQKLQHMQLL